MGRRTIYPIWRLSEYHADNRRARAIRDCASGQILIFKWGRDRPPVARAHDRRLGTECQQSGGSADRSRTPANSELAKFGSARRDDRRGRADQIRAGWRRRERLESRPAYAHRHTAEFRLVRDDGRLWRRAGPRRIEQQPIKVAQEDGSRRTDVTSSAEDQQTLQPGNPIDE